MLNCVQTIRGRTVHTSAVGAVDLWETWRVFQASVGKRGLPAAFRGFSMDATDPQRGSFFSPQGTGRWLKGSGRRVQSAQAQPAEVDREAV